MHARTGRFLTQTETQRAACCSWWQMANLASWICILILFQLAAVVCAPRGAAGVCRRARHAIHCITCASRTLWAVARAAGVAFMWNPVSTLK